MPLSRPTDAPPPVGAGTPGPVGPWAAAPHRGGLRVGLDIGGTKVDAALVLPDGSLLASARAATPTGTGPLLDLAAALVTELAPPEATGGWRALAGVGVGVPGVVDHRAGTVAESVNLGLHGRSVPLAALLSERLAGVPVAVDNDVNACALGAGAAFEAPADLVLLSIGTGVAAGIVEDGVLRRGTHGAAGEVGHLVVDPGGHPCACGQRGCLETVVAGPAVQRAWPSAAPGRAAGALFRAAEAGDPRAHRLRETWAETVAVALQGLALTLDPRHLVLAGGVATSDRSAAPRVAHALRRLADGSSLLTRLRLDRRLSLVDADRPVAAIGAALLAPLPVPRPS